VTRVYLIRHGETVGAEPKRYKGTTDVPLSERGIEQIKRLARCLSQNTERRTQNTDNRTQTTGRVKNSGLTALYCSGLSRALRSAELIGESFGIAPLVHHGLRERDFGAWEGMSFDEVETEFPDAFRRWAENPLEFSPMGGESTIEVRDRAMKTFREITERHKGAVIAIVSHGGINRVILCELLGMPLENIFRIEQDFGALNVIEMWDYPVVKLINGIGVYCDTPLQV
jgi:alpha-ribazole phosphatase